jgi:hypothetical protein
MPRQPDDVRSSGDTVAKVENRTTLKISRKLILSCLYGCNPLSADTKVGGSFLCETMWSLTSPRAKRISGPKKFRSSPKKDFFNTIRAKADIPPQGRDFRF